MFVLADGRNVTVTFVLVSSLFLLWGFCNGMIDVMDKHFQSELHLTLAQSAWVQFAHYLGYFLMALPAGWLATKLGYKGGIITGLLMVAAGGFWFIPATSIASFWAFLVGVCVIASGLTFLETIANPYTTVLGTERYAATRINLAQSCNGIGWIFGPIAGAAFFYGKDASGRSTGAETLWIPYAAVGVVVLLLAVVFCFAPVPDIKMEDDYHLDDGAADVSHSIWSHPHFTMAVAAQFLYVAAQAGIFSFFINYMTSQTPPIPGKPARRRPRELVRAGHHRRGALHQRRRRHAGVARIRLLPDRALHRRRHPAGVRRAPRAGPLRALNVLACLVVVLKLGWVSVASVFASLISSCRSCSPRSSRSASTGSARAPRRPRPSSSWRSSAGRCCRRSWALSGTH